MMNKTEKQFYKVFEIKKTDICKHAQHGYEGEEGTWYFCKKDNKECWTYPNSSSECVEKDFPPITDSIYMEFMVIIQRNHLVTESYPEIQTKEELKEFILMALLQNVDIVKREIQELFKTEKGIVDNNV